MKKIILAFAGLALVLSSCEDFLTKEPPMNQSDALALSTFQGLNEATNGNYIGFASWYGETFPLTFDLMCGNAMVGPVNTGRMRSEPAWNYTPTATLGIWSGGYNVILGCNKVLEAIEKNEFSRDNSVTQADINNVKAENLTIRALAYFDMVRVYGQSYSYIKDNGITGDAALGVPVVTVDDLSARPARATVAEVYEFIIKELEAAEKLMAASYQRADVTDLRATITLPVIQAAMARVYLEHQDWQLAADYATKVIKNSSFKLLSGSKYVEMWSGNTDVPATTGNEILFEVYISKNDGTSSGLGDLLTAPAVSGGAGYGDVRVSNDLIVLYDDSDVRLTGLTKINKFQDTEGKYRWSTKYPGKSGQLAYNNVPIMRLSEMYLVRAEAIFRGASVSGVTALADLNQVATARGAQPYGNATIENIFAETRKEFLFEGHVFFDMKRLQLPLNRTDFVLSLNKDIPFPDYRWALPVPKHETDNNKNIRQNPGYNVQ